MSENTKIELPPKYYLDYFTFLLRFVERMYTPILNDAELSFLRQFDQLSQDAQCLYIRFSNRKGSFFRVNKLKYAEIDDIPAALYELADGGFIAPLSDSHAADLEEILGVLTREDLLKLTPATSWVRALKKPELVRFLRLEHPSADLIDAINNLEAIVRTSREVEVMMFKFLFFGNRHGDMTEFVVRDLGMINFQQYRDDEYTARFASRQEAEDKLLVSLANEQFFELKDQKQLPPEDVFHWFASWRLTVPNLSAVAMPGFHKLANRVGLFLERQKCADQALSVYELTDQAPARERRARLLLKTGAPDEALALCDDIERTAQNADERFFALDFKAQILNTKKRTKKSTTQFLQNATSVAIPASNRGRVEAGVVAHYNQNGHHAVHCENYPWRGLLGLVFWDIIFDTNVQAIHHPLQRIPSDFYLPDFFEKRQTQIHAHLNTLKTTQDYDAWIDKIFDQKYGTANVLVEWSDVMLALVRLLISKLTPQQLTNILLEMAANMRENTHGFPDLLVWTDNSYELVEVKSPTDHLSAQQLHWLKLFDQWGVNAKVLRVVWEDIPTH